LNLINLVKCFITSKSTDFQSYLKPIFTKNNNNFINVNNNNNIINNKNTKHGTISKESNIAYIDINKNSIDKIYEEYINFMLVVPQQINNQTITSNPKAPNVPIAHITENQFITNQIPETPNEDIVTDKAKAEIPEKYPGGFSLNNDKWFSSNSKENKESNSNSNVSNEKNKENKKVINNKNIMNESKKVETVKSNKTNKKSKEQKIEEYQKVKALDEIMEIFCCNLNNLPRHYVINAFKVNNFKVIDTYKFLINYFKRFNNNNINNNNNKLI